MYCCQVRVLRLLAQIGLPLWSVLVFCLLRDQTTLNALPSTGLQATATQHLQEHQLEHWKMAVGGHKKECKRLKAEKEASDAAAARSERRAFPAAVARGRGGGLVGSIRERHEQA